MPLHFRAGERDLYTHTVTSGKRGRWCSVPQFSRPTIIKINYFLVIGISVLIWGLKLGGRPRPNLNSSAFLPLSRPGEIRIRENPGIFRGSRDRSLRMWDMPSTDSTIQMKMARAVSLLGEERYPRLCRQQISEAVVPEDRCERISGST